MKKVFILILFLAGLNINSFAQETKYFDAPFGGGGGFIPGWFFSNVDDLNNRFGDLGLNKLSSSGIFTTGGGGFIYIGFIPHLRVGGIGFGGSSSRDKLIGNYRYETVYNISGGGLTVEYSLKLISDMGISVGALIGGGQLKIDLYKNSGNFTWENLWDEFSSENSPNFHREIKNDFWFFSPMLNLDIPFNRFIVIRLGGGYQLTFGESWAVDNDRSLNNVPKDLNGDGFFLHSGIFFGFFSF